MIVPPEEDIIAFVHSTYGQDASRKLQNIHQGGLNNEKGRDYENQFLLYKTFEIANKYPHDCNNQIIASQTIGFVDDLCHIDYEENIKYNFQAKNSSGNAAKWTEDIADRFRKQRAIDTSLFKVNSTKNCLLVSDEARTLENKEKIPNDLKSKDACEYFKFHPNIYELVHNTKLYHYVATLIENPSSNECDYAVTLINGSLQAGKHTTISDIFRQAESNANPNPFIKFRTSTHKLPSWVQQILTNNSHCVMYSLNYDKLILTINQMFKVTCSIKSLNEVPKSIVDNTKSIQELVSLMLSVTGDDIKQSLNSSKMGEVK
ncbi:hypothetical protein QL919_12925 [Psychrobacter sp. APC 3426]|uniref:hypothetical protein n=1 Tax=Psychrobacter sp. APC 3426 TaxID=3035177 RepID=UPI0025B33516|nr:hypothetical protein [Psychrobacter sp. APC 3426]MDN3399630.1 hypothetical protein [Psychrobacter sp. APC 3426]